MRLKSAPLVIAFAAGVIAASAQAAPQGERNGYGKGAQCFYSHDWQDWRALDDKTIILRVRVHDYYRIDFSHRCPELLSPTARIINEVRGSSLICGPLDLDIRVSDFPPGGATACIVKSMKKLTPEEVSKIPKKALP